MEAFLSLLVWMISVIVRAIASRFWEPGEPWPRRAEEKKKNDIPDRLVTFLYPCIQSIWFYEVSVVFRSTQGTGGSSEQQVNDHRICYCSKRQL